MGKRRGSTDPQALNRSEIALLLVQFVGWQED